MRSCSFFLPLVEYDVLFFYINTENIKISDVACLDYICQNAYFISVIERPVGTFVAQAHNSENLIQRRPV